MSISFTEYIKIYPEALRQINVCLGQTKLPILENIALRFTHALEENLLDLKQGNERVFLFDLLTKTTNEMFGTVGALRNGALIPSYHHTRSMFELYAALEHVYCTPAKQERKLQKYVEYKNVAKYLHYQGRKRMLLAGQITERDMAESCPISEAEFGNLEARIPEWNRIWKLEGLGPNLIPNWHYPATIQGLFEASDTTKTFWSTYENICHATHLSPLGLGLTKEYLLLGFPRDASGYDYERINWPIVYCVLAAQAIANFLHSTVCTGLIQGVLDFGVEDLKSS